MPHAAAAHVTPGALDWRPPRAVPTTAFTLIPCSCPAASDSSGEGHTHSPPTSASPEQHLVVAQPERAANGDAQAPTGMPFPMRGGAPSHASIGVGTPTPIVNGMEGGGVHDGADISDEKDDSGPPPLEPLSDEESAHPVPLYPRGQDAMSSAVAPVPVPAPAATSTAPEAGQHGECPPPSFAPPFVFGRSPPLEQEQQEQRQNDGPAGLGDAVLHQQQHPASEASQDSRPLSLDGSEDGNSGDSAQQLAYDGDDEGGGLGGGTQAAAKDSKGNGGTAAAAAAADAAAVPAAPAAPAGLHPSLGAADGALCPRHLAAREANLPQNVLGMAMGQTAEVSQGQAGAARGVDDEDDPELEDYGEEDAEEALRSDEGRGSASTAQQAAAATFLRPTHHSAANAEDPDHAAADVEELLRQQAPDLEEWHREQAEAERHVAEEMARRKAEEAEAAQRAAVAAQRAEEAAAALLAEEERREEEKAKKVGNGRGQGGGAPRKQGRG